MTIPQWIFDSTTINLSIILSCFLITYIRLLGKDFYWVIDDLDGIARFSETYNEKEHRKNDSYEINGKQHKFLSFIPELGFPGSVLRFFRLHIGKKYQVIGKNKQGHDVWGYVQSPIRHHILSLVVQSVCLVLAYTFLINYIPVPIAFGAVLLYAVHPLTTQVVGWISGVNYSISMMFALLLINCAIYLHAPELKYVLIALLSFCTTITVYLGGFTFLILLFLGFKIEALVAGVIAISILIFEGMKTKKYRSDAFKEQNMSATLSLNFRKPIVMLKTLWYYMRMVFFPIKMGLYHVWGYFYEDPIERVDRMFFLGAATLVAFVALFIFGDFACRLGIIWFFAYFLLFTNAITAQQFVADRYATIPSFGICLILSSFLYGTPLFWVLVGAYIVRTYLHLPTFKNEIDFYQSNWLNFRKSEVSLGNLGVAYVNQGMPGCAVDTWTLATKLNPYYDVPWYNLYSVFKGQGQLPQAREFLVRCLDAKVVHFEKRWKEELVELDEMIANPNKKPTEMKYHEAADHYKAGSTALELKCLETFLASDTNGLLPEMINQVKLRVKNIHEENKLHNPVQGQKRPSPSGSNPLNLGAGLSQEVS